MNPILAVLPNRRPIIYSSTTRPNTRDESRRRPRRILQVERLKLKNLCLGICNMLWFRSRFGRGDQRQLSSKEIVPFERMDSSSNLHKRCESCINLQGWQSNISCVDPSQPPQNHFFVFFLLFVITPPLLLAAVVVLVAACRSAFCKIFFISITCFTASFRRCI